MRLIDADAFKQTFCAECVRTQCENCNIKHHFEHLAPTVDPVKHGHWINISISANEYEPSSAQCNLCGTRVYNNFSSVINYCPNCGAKMGEDRDYEHAVEQLEHNMTFEPTYDSEDGSM